MKFPPWLNAPLASLGSDRRSPQALLIHGSRGSGRRLLALHHGARLLGIPASRLEQLAAAEPEAEGQVLGHPDLMLLQPPPEKTAIPVASIRRLVDFLQLKSHQGGARVAIIWPADGMTTAAANSLLKTLEEPPPGGYILLVVSTPTALPATIISRCHRLAVHLPRREAALAWLRGQAGEADWELLLDIAGGAPLRALDLAHADFAAEARQFDDDIRQIEATRLSTIAVAQRWSNCNGEWLWQWLYWRLAHAIRQRAGAGADAMSLAPLQNDGKAPNMRVLLQRLADVEELRRIGSGAARMDLQYAAMLQRWYA